MVTQMETDFVDLATRALAFTFVYYNAPVDMFTVFRVLFEYRYVTLQSTAQSHPQVLLH